MIKTGFYDIVTRKEAERRVESNYEYERQLRRMKELNIKIPSTDIIDNSSGGASNSSSSSSNSNSNSNGGKL